MDGLQQISALVPTFEQLAAGTGTAQLDDQTPCEDWKVRDLFAHLIGGATMFAAVMRGDAPGEPPAPSDEDVPSAAVAAAKELEAAFGSPGALERVVDTPFGQMPGEVFARLIAFDLLMHLWDLSTATGQALVVPDGLVEEIDGFARQTVAPELRVPGVFGPEVEPAPDASRLEALVAFSGRSA